MNHPCGCASAEQCWRHCCCTTLEQRLAWARDNHVTPPNYALAEARQHGIDWEAYCNAGAEHESHLCRDGDGVAPSCCQHHGTAAHCCAAHGKAGHSVTPGVVLLEALACSGCDQNWMGVSVSLAPPPQVRVAASFDVARLTVAPSPRLVSISFAPATPPPRSLAG